MKQKILMLIIGALIGAIITTGVFMIINKNKAVNTKDRMKRGQMGEPPSMNGNVMKKPDGDMPTEQPSIQNTTDNSNNI